MKGHVGVSIDHHCESISMRFASKVLGRDVRVFLQPLSRGPPSESGPQCMVDLISRLLQFRTGIELPNGAIWIRQKHCVKLRAEFGANTKQRKECVIDSGNVAPKVNETIPSRRDLPLKLFFGKSLEELINTGFVELPRLQSRFDQ